MSTAQRKFWRCVESGEPPSPIRRRAPWAEFAGIFARTRAAYLEQEQAKAEFERFIPQDAKEAIGHGGRANAERAGLSALLCVLIVWLKTQPKPCLAESRSPYRAS